MSGYDVLKIVSTVVLSLGGGGMIVFLLSGWLGRVWANRLMEEDRAKHARALEALKTEFEAVNKKVQAELDKTVFVHRVQFETEFKALSEIWASVVDVRGTMIGLRPVFDVVSKDDDELKRLKERFAPFVKALSELKHVTYVNSPFYPIEIHK